MMDVVTKPEKEQLQKDKEQLRKDKEKLHKRAVELRDRYEAALESYVNYGIGYLKIDALTHHEFAKTHDAETSLSFEIRERCEMAFHAPAPNDDEEIETDSDESPENDEAKPVHILERFAEQARHCSGVRAAMRTAFEYTSRLLDKAMNEMTKLEDELSRLKADVQALEAMAKSGNEDTSADTAPTALDELDIRTWRETVMKLVTVKCPQVSENALRDENVLGHPTTGPSWSKTKEELGIICEFEPGDEANATVVRVEGISPA